MVVRIYKPAKTAMQSGRARTMKWVLEYEPEAPSEVEPLMGWTATTDAHSQVRLEFDRKEEAVAYAKERGLPYRVIAPKEPKIVRKSYADNFKFDRLEPWTH